MPVRISEQAFVHPSAQLYGEVSIGARASVWCNAVIRSETAFVEVGEGTNLQDFVMVHTDPGKPVRIGRFCSITHRATLHGCTIEDHVLIGINATIYNGAHIGAGSIVGQHAYVRDNMQVPPRSIVVDSPARVLRSADSRLANRINAEFYMLNADAYKAGNHRAWDGPEFQGWMAETMARLAAEYA